MGSRLLREVRCRTGQVRPARRPGSFALAYRGEAARRPVPFQYQEAVMPKHNEYDDSPGFRADEQTA